MIKWSRVRLIFSILTCEGLFATLRERVQYAPPPPASTGEKSRTGKLSLPRYYDYSGAVHVHSTYSDGAGTIDEVAAAANKAGLDFVVMCDHSSLAAREGGEDGWRGRTLVLIGTEVTTDTGHLLALDVPPAFLPTSDDAVKAQQAILDSGGIGFIALPCDLKDHWRDFDRHLEGIGLEVFNLSAIARTKINLPGVALAWKRYKSSHPQQVFSLVAARPSRELRLWDRLTAPSPSEDTVRRVVGIASLDAHAVMKFAGRTFPFPTYEEVFRTLRTHVLTRTPLSGGETSASLRAEATEADSRLIHHGLAEGHCYMAYDNYADPTGFVFEATPQARRSPPALMGDSVPQGANLRLTVSAPRTRSLVRLFRNGLQIAATRGGFLEHVVSEPGVYRAEVFLYKRRIGGLCLGARPWIFSNPIYVEPVPTSTASSAGQKAESGAR